MRSQSIFFLFAIIGIMFEQCLGSNDTDFSGYNTIDTGSPPTFSCNDTARERVVLRDPCGTIISPCYFDENYNLTVDFGVKIYDLNANNGTEIVAYQLIIREFETSYFLSSLYFYPSQFASFQNGLFQTDDSFHQYVLSGSASSDAGIYIGRENSNINVNGSLLLNNPSYVMQFVSKGFTKRGFRLNYCADFNLCEPDVICSSSVGGKCRRNGFRSYSCVCNTGYTGPACVDANECLASPCNSNAQCENSPGSFTCKCNDGFTGDGFNCLLDQTKVTLKSTTTTSTSPSVSATNSGLSTSSTPSVSATNSGLSTSSTPSVSATDSGLSTSSTPSVSATNSGLSTSTTPSVSATNSKSSTSGITSPTFTSLTSNTGDRNDTGLRGTGKNDVSADENYIVIIAGAGGAALFLLSVFLFICRKKSKKSEKRTYKSFDAAGQNNST